MIWFTSPQKTILDSILTEADRRSQLYLFFFTGVVAEVEAGALVVFVLNKPLGCLF